MNKIPNTISVVCPVYNEAATIPEFYRRLSTVLDGLSERKRFEIIFTNNCSTDKTLEILHEIRARDPRVNIVTFSRNFGYQASVLAGLSLASGDAMCVIDTDGEDPPEMLPRFIDKYEEGYDIVYGLRQGRAEPQPLTLVRKAFYRILHAVADYDAVLDMAEFSLMSERVRDQVMLNSNSFPFIRGEIAYCGFKRFGIPYNREARIGGESKYNLFRMFLFAAGGLLTASTFPFRLATYLFPLVALLSVGVALFGSPEAVLRVLMLDCLYLTTLVTLHGLYLARMYKNGISRPLFIIDQLNTTVPVVSTRRSTLYMRDDHAKANLSVLSRGE